MNIFDDTTRHTIAGMHDEITELQIKNYHLQELVEDMLDYIEIRAAFNRPTTDKMCEEFAQRARNLGIEVDE